MKTKGRATTVDSRIGYNLQLLRRVAGLSQKQIGDNLGVSSQQIQKYESGKNRLPAAALYKLKHIYDVPYEDFFTGIEETTVTS